MDHESLIEEAPFSLPEHHRVAVVTVTYGNRRHLLEEVITRCLANHIKRIIVVNNGANWNFDSLHNRYPDCDIRIILMDGNKGSAAAYSAGIRLALECNTYDFLWLLDDDLAPENECLAILMKEYSSLAQTVQKNKIAVLAARLEFIETLSSGRYRRLMNPPNNAFLEFSVADLWPKIKKRLPWHPGQARNTDLPNAFSVQMAPYGGLLFHRSVIENIGLPDNDFVLYVDDYEYTDRIVRSGGNIMLIPSARLKELEQCWNSGQSHFSSFHAWLSGSDFRAYYTARNMSYFETHVRNNRGSLYRFNKFTYLTILRLIALLQRRGARMRLLRDAIRAGVAGRLGLDNRFPLP